VIRKGYFLRRRGTSEKKVKRKVVLVRAKFAEGMCKRCGKVPPSEPGKSFCSDCLKKMSVGGAMIWAMSHLPTSDREYREWLGVRRK